jgi:phosphoribosylamine--glycine ligase
MIQVHFVILFAEMLTAAIANVPGNDFEAIKAFVIQEKVTMVVVGPRPFGKGIYDFF